MYYCDGKDFATGVVQGRIGANGTTGPYTGRGYCRNACTPQDIPNQNDGYKACQGFNHVVTVWRNVDTSTATAGTAAAFDPALDYKVCNKQSGQCVDAKGGGTTNGTPIVQNPYSSTSTSMRWNIVKDSYGKYKFINKKSGKVMAIQGGATYNGCPLILYTADGTPSQSWSFTRTADGAYKFSPGTSASMSLDNSNNSTAPGNPIVQWSFTGGLNQEWVVAPAN